MSTQQLGYYEIPIDENLRSLLARYPRVFHGLAPTYFSHVDTGWVEVIDRLFKAVDAAISGEEADDIRVLTIKEKAGGLRVHIAFGDEHGEPPEDWPTRRVEAREAKLMELLDLINAAEREADKTCSYCGAPARLRLLMAESPIAPNGFMEWPSDGVFKHGGAPSVVCDFHAIRKNRQSIDAVE
jgi:hypothetical protein